MNCPHCGHELSSDDLGIKIFPIKYEPAPACAGNYGVTETVWVNTIGAAAVPAMPSYVWNTIATQTK